MTNQEKDLLLTDLCSRLPYGVIIHYHYENTNDVVLDEDRDLDFSDVETLKYVIYNPYAEPLSLSFRPYLRPLSSMTEEEDKELFQLMGNGNDIQRVDFYNSHHFDYRGLIEKGLALEAPEDMYKDE